MNRKDKKHVEEIPKSSTVKAYFYGHTVEINDAPVPRQTTVVLPGHRYMDLVTGEVKKMEKHSQNRSDNLKSVKATMANLRRLIGANFRGGRTELWVTLTYSCLIRKTAIVYRDFKVFMQRVRKQEWGQYLEYLAVIEPQATGSWHLHVLFKRNDGKSLYVANSEMEQLWRHGFTKTKRLKQTDNVAAYLIAYLTNLAGDTDKTAKIPKQIVKGGRLYLYPANIRIFRHSRGIKQPLVRRDTKRKILTENGIGNDADQRYQRKYRRHDQVITITTEFYNLNTLGKEGENHEEDA